MHCNDRKDLLCRLKRIEGQIRGIHKMVEEERYCVDILNQISAAKAGLNKVGLLILENHTRGCVANALKGDNGEDALDELVEVLDKFMK